MADYAAPIADMRFVLNEIAGFPELAKVPAFEAATDDVVDAILEEASKLAGEVLAPLNAPGDRTGATFKNGAVRMPDGFADAYRHLVEGGWNSLPFEADYGGQGLPWSLAFAVQEMWHAANMSLGLCPMLSQGAIELLSAKGSPALKEAFLPKMIAGSWTGTMDLTESQAGSDLSTIRTKAVRSGEGPFGPEYRLFGEKIYITFGDHDLAENIIHLVLARTPDAPEGVKGLSVFLVPKFLPDADGNPGQRNDVRCTGIEHKLGIMASPTASLVYGESEGAVGYLVGEEAKGLPAMFTMMNNARLSVGLEGVAIAERAYQQARAFARERIQGTDIAKSDGDKVPIIRHPDVRRMLMLMKAQTEAARAVAYEAAVALDRGRVAPDADNAAQARGRADLLTPVVKAWGTEIGCEVSSLGIQVHGGMGYVEETGAAQYYRDARIAPIYEGTNGIQAQDLVFRKVARDGGKSVQTYLTDLKALVETLRGLPGDDIARIRSGLHSGMELLVSATDWVLEHARTDVRAVAAGATPYLHLFGVIAGQAAMARGAAAVARALADGSSDSRFLEAKLITARFYTDHILPRANAHMDTLERGHLSIMALAEDQF